MSREDFFNQAGVQYFHCTYGNKEWVLGFKDNTCCELCNNFWNDGWTESLHIEPWEDHPSNIRRTKNYNTPIKYLDNFLKEREIDL